MRDLLTASEYAALAETMVFPANAFIDGSFRPSMSGRTFPTINPATGATLANVAACDAADVDYAVAKAKEATLAAIAQGADVHYNILNLGVRGMEQAAREKGTKMIGSYTNYCSDNNPLYIAYTVSGIGFMVEYAIDQAVAGTWHPEYKQFGLAMGPRSADIEICAGATPEIQARIKELKDDLLSSKIKVKVG